MSHTEPVLFVSHGSPSLLIDRDPTTGFFKSLGKQINKPRSILSISAHWETQVPQVTGHMEPETIHDFYGFPSELYDIFYPCPGSSELVDLVKASLNETDLRCSVDPERGLDHGTWVPLKLMFPEADVPVVQLSLQFKSGPEYHYKLGQALQNLRKEGVLILCSGSATHNIRGFGRYALDAPPEAYAVEFDQWLKEKIDTNNINDLLAYRSKAPQAEINHPTEEHFLPLFVAMGAAEQQTGKLINSGYTYGLFSMAAYQWG